MSLPSASVVLPRTFFTIRTPVVKSDPQPPKIRMPEDEAPAGPVSRMPGDVIAHYHAGAAAADLDPVLRDVRDSPPSLDRICTDRNRGVRPVRDDPTFLIEGDSIAGDRTGRARAIAGREIINPNAVLPSIGRVLADIVDAIAGDIHRRCAEMSEVIFAGDDDAKVVGALNFAAFDGAA